MGVVSVLGTTLDELRASCREGRDVVRAVLETESLPTTCAAPIDAFTGKIQDFGELEDAKKKAIRKGVKLMAREIQMGVAAAQHAIADANIAGAYPCQRVGASVASDYVGTTAAEFIEAMKACHTTTPSGEREFDGSHWRENGVAKMTPIWQLKYLTNMTASHITIYNEFYGPAFDVTNREASFGAAIADAVETIRCGRADAMLVGSTGSRVHPLRLIEAIKNEEVASEIVKGEGSCERSVSRPFDARRSGYIPSEGAGALFIESAEHAIARGAKIYAEVCGGVCRAVLKHAKDVEKAVNPVEEKCDLAETLEASREAIRLTLKGVMRQYGASIEKLGFIAANARGDKTLDAAEALALRDVFGDELDAIPVTALAGLMGNPGAGGAAISTVAGLLAMQDGAVFKTYNYGEADANCPVKPVCEDGVATGDSMLTVCANNIGQASAALFKRWNG